jgi:hypothetical protein
MIGFGRETVCVYDTVGYEDNDKDCNETSSDILPQAEDPNGEVTLYGASNEVRALVHVIIPSRGGSFVNPAP